MEDTQAYIARKNKPSGQCAYEKYQEFQPSSISPWEELSFEEQTAWFQAAVEGWKKIQEANTDKRYTT